MWVPAFTNLRLRDFTIAFSDPIAEPLDQDGPKITRREDAMKMKNMREPDGPDVGRIMARLNAEKAARY